MFTEVITLCVPLHYDNSIKKCRIGVFFSCSGIIKFRLLVSLSNDEKINWYT